MAKHSEDHRDQMVRYLDRHLSGREIRTVKDLKRVLAECDRGRAHFQKGLKNLFKFLEWAGWPEEALGPFRRTVRVEKASVDNGVPDEAEVLESLKAVHEYIARGHGGRHTKAEMAYWALYNVLLDSGARLRHAVEAMNCWDEERLKEHGGSYVYVLNKSEGTKAQPYLFLTPYTVELVRTVRGQLSEMPLTERGAKHFYKRRRAAMPKYIRKFVFTRLVALGVPESVADFIQGRVARTVGARHYLARLELAKAYYGRYARYLGGLRARAGLAE